MFRVLIRSYLVVQFVLGCLFFVASCSAEIIDNSESGYVIVIPDAANVVEKTAADELACHLEKMTGVKLPIVEESKAGDKKIISIGRTDFAKKVGLDSLLSNKSKEAFVIAPRGNALCFLGNSPRGTLYGVYEYLDGLGVRWFTDDCNKIPAIKSLALPKADVVCDPPFEYRDQMWNVYWKDPWKARNRLNGEFQRISKEFGGSARILLKCHSIQILVPADVARKHEQWRALKEDGKRDEPTSHYVQICYTNPQVRKYILDGVKNRLAREPGADQIWVSQSDGPCGCYCDDCKSERDKYGGEFSANVICLANYIAENIEDQYPNVKVKTLAYGSTVTPPIGLKAHKNVLVVLCGPPCNFHDIETCPKNAVYCDSVKKWLRCSNIQTYFYGANNSEFMAPNPNWLELCKQYKFMSDAGAKNVYRQGAGVGLGSEFIQLRNYVNARMAWNPELDPQNEIDEFVECYYGPAAKYIKEYMAAWPKRVQADPEKYHESWKEWFTNEDVEAATKLFEAALKEVEGQPEYYARVREAYLPIVYARVVKNIRSEPVFADGEYKLILDNQSEKTNNAAGLFCEIMAEAGYTHLGENTRYNKEHNIMTALSRKHEYCELSGKDSKVIIVPSLGGRIVKWNMDGYGNLFRPVDVRNGRYPYLAGYEEYSHFEMNSEGYAVDFKVKSEDPHKVVLFAKFKNGLECTRTFMLDDEGLKLNIKSEYRNAGKKGIKVKLRSHPEFAFEVFSSPELKYQNRNNELITVPMYSPQSPTAQKCFDAKEFGSGKWCLVDQKKNIGLLNSFDLKDMQNLYTFWGKPLGVVNLEIWQKEVTLLPGESQVLEQSFEFINDMKGFSLNETR